MVALGIQFVYVTQPGSIIKLFRITESSVTGNSENRLFAVVGIMASCDLGMQFVLDIRNDLLFRTAAFDPPPSLSLAHAFQAEDMIRMKAGLSANRRKSRRALYHLQAPTLFIRKLTLTLCQTGSDSLVIRPGRRKMPQLGFRET